MHDYSDARVFETPPTLTVELGQARPAVPLLRAVGELVPSTASTLFGPLGRELGKRPWALVLDLSALSTMHAEVVPVLVDVARWAGEADIGLCIVVTDAVVPPVLQDAGVLQLFELHRDLDGALDAVS
ncbi:STAS domain-containing protein [Pseudonocardia acidicola]|nr:STAS domain-containing protein [Pseudonocardia acidicola]